MATRSSWLAHLPPVLWDGGPGAASSLGEALCVFEKVFTGIDDGVETARPPVVAGIAEAARQLDPWTAHPDFLSWLAGWLDLELPTLRGDHLWSEHRRRTVVSRIAATSRQRGRPAGLADHLRLVAAGDVAPRIALDDGARVLTVVPDDAGPAPVTALVTQGPVVHARPAVPAGPGTSAVDAVQTLVADGLVRPDCIAVGGDGALFLGDVDPADDRLDLGNRVWRIDPDGRYQVTGAAGPTPFVTAGLGQLRVRAIAVAPPRAGRPETLYLLDQNGRLSGVPTATPGATPDELVGTLAESTVPFQPAAMTVDRDGNLIVLVDRNEPGVSRPPRVITVVTPGGTVRRRDLTRVTAPQSVLVDADGSLLIGDGGEQSTDGPADRPGNIVRSVRSGATWTETVLLPTDRVRNPLVAPTGLARAGDGTLFVLDAGVRPLDAGTQPSLRAVAVDPVVHRVDLDVPGGPTVAPASDAGRMVYPTGLVHRAGRLVICDPGQPHWSAQPVRWTRLLPFRFEVVVHFTVSRLPGDTVERQAVLTRTLLDIQAAVERQKPAHTVCTTIA